VTGIAFNLLNLAVVGSLVFRQQRENGKPFSSAPAGRLAA
jgi:hypothetical protein